MESFGEMVCEVQIVDPLNSHHLPSLHMFTMSAFSTFHACDNCGTLSPRRAMVSGRGPMNLMPAASPGTIRITSRSQRRGAQLRQHFLPHQKCESVATLGLFKQITRIVNKTSEQLWSECTSQAAAKSALSDRKP